MDLIHHLIMNLIMSLIPDGSEGINNVILNGMLGVAYKTEYSKYKSQLSYIFKMVNQRRVFLIK